MRIGDIVLIQDSNAVRGQWKNGRVMQTFPGNDGKVRNVEVQYKCFPMDDKSKEYKGKAYTTIQHPVQKLVVILPIEESYKTIAH